MYSRTLSTDTQTHLYTRPYLLQPDTSTSTGCSPILTRD